MKLPKDSRVLKLPLWAQEEMARLEQKALDAERRAERAEGKFPGTDVQRVDGMRLCDLPPNSQIRFRLGPEFWNWIDVRRDDREGPQLEVVGGDLLLVRPLAANHFHVENGRPGAPRTKDNGGKK